MRHVGLLGLGESLMEAPFGDPSIEFWGMSNGHAVFPAFAVRRWFEMHPLDLCMTRDPGYLQWAKTCERPLYMLSAFLGIPSSRTYPKADVLGVVGRPYMTSTVAWMLGMCLWETDITEVSLYGINLSAAEEYRRQRPCAEYLVGRLEGQGVTVHIADGSILCRDGRLYGYDEPTAHHDLVTKYAVGGLDTITLDGVPVRGIYIDPHPSLLPSKGV